MAHYAKVVDGKVKNVIVAEEDFFLTFMDDTPGKWLQTSYNTHGGVHYEAGTRVPDDGIPFRKNFAGIGDTYDSTRDAFIPSKVYGSWILNEETCQWEAPVARPEDDKGYEWKEDSLSWVENL